MSQAALAGGCPEYEWFSDVDYIGGKERVI